MSNVNVSLIIPCFNEGLDFSSNINKILKQLNKLRRGWEIIFVEDHSTDQTKKVVQKLTSDIPNSRAIYHSKNQGRGKSVSDGILVAKGEICGYLDADLEVSADYIPLFVKEVESGKDLVVGERFYGGGGVNALTRFLASKIYAIAVKYLLDTPINDTEAGYKFFRRKKIALVLKKVKNKHWFWDTEICIRSYIGGLKVSQIPVLFKRREDKKSTVKLLPDTIDYIKNLVRFKRELMITSNK